MEIYIHIFQTGNDLIKLQIDLIGVISKTKSSQSGQVVIRTDN